MKKTILLAAIAILAFGIVSCQKDSFGFDKTVTISAEGGKMTLRGDAPIQTLSITDYDGNGEEDSSVSSDVVKRVSYLWLYAESAPYTNVITIKAEPNTSGKSRTLYVSGMVRDTHTEIKVIQKK